MCTNMRWRLDDSFSIDEAIKQFYNTVCPNRIFTDFTIKTCFVSFPMDEYPSKFCQNIMPLLLGHTRYDSKDPQYASKIGNMLGNYTLNLILEFNKIVKMFDTDMSQTGYPKIFCSGHLKDVRIIIHSYLDQRALWASKISNMIIRSIAYYSNYATALPPAEKIVEMITQLPLCDLPLCDLPQRTHNGESSSNVRTKFCELCVIKKWCNKCQIHVCNLHECGFDRCTKIHKNATATLQCKFCEKPFDHNEIIDNTNMTVWLDSRISAQINPKKLKKQLRNKLRGHRRAIAHGFNNEWHCVDELKYAKILVDGIIIYGAYDVPR